MGSFKKLSVWVIIGLLTTAITIPANGSESEESTNGAGRRHQKMEEVIVVGSRETMEVVSFKVGLSDVILIHDYDKDKKEWKLVSIRDSRRGTTKTITH
jgi:hypothetical protein